MLMLQLTNVFGFIKYYPILKYYSSYLILIKGQCCDDNTVFLSDTDLKNESPEAQS